MTRVFAALFALFLGTSLAAQLYPDPRGAVNDYADMLDDAQEAALLETIDKIFEDHDAQVTVATLSSVQFYAQDTDIADYATGLFNDWGVGQAEESTGILLLIFRDDRELRVELGDGYGSAWRKAAQGAVNGDILPHFRAGDFPAGIQAGVDGLRDRIIVPFNNGEAAPVTEPSGEGGGNGLWILLGGIVAAVGGLIGLGKYRAAKFAQKPCPSCGKTGLTKENVTLREATIDDEGLGETRVICPHCGHVDSSQRKISKLTPKDDGPAFDGGKSKGDGASGRW